ncbi:sulfotransferase family 2 domain-containing protein [Seohaeicola saemankumensis]|nr:sulfotransferase family 2 domain-containing protein [Seohaeicola saemankumensis]MCA0873729.1 sulfotransferase family 2 domain-containing protein [Seohaeicola saemankumensis]
MLVFHNERLVFLSVPKTGTTAFETALRDRATIVITDPPELKHAPVYRYNRFFRPMFEKVCHARMETMAVMREPVSWLGSWYRYRRRPFMKGRPNSTHDVSFDEFVTAYLKGDKPGFARVGSQAKFLEPRPNGVSIDHLFRYEEPGRLIGFLEERLKVPVAPGQANVSPKMELTLSPETLKRYRRKCAEEFDLYDSIGSV